MRISSVIGLYFSPTGTTRTLVTAAAEQAAQTLGVPFRLISLNTPAERETVFHFSADTLVIVGAPTYAGRLPNKIFARPAPHPAWQRLSCGRARDLRQPRL